MKCPECKGKLAVIDMVRSDDEIYRRRKCTVCGRTVYSVEFEVEGDEKFHSTWHYCDLELRRERYRRKKEKKV